MPRKSCEKSNGKRNEFPWGWPRKSCWLGWESGEIIRVSASQNFNSLPSSIWKKKTIKERRKSGVLVINNQCHAKAVKKVMGKGINFLEGGPEKIVDLTEKAG